MESDYPVAEEILNAEAPELPKETVVVSGSSPGTAGDSTGLGGVTFVQCATGGTSPISTSPIGSYGDSKCKSNNYSFFFFTTHFYSFHFSSHSPIFLNLKLDVVTFAIILCADLSYFEGLALCGNICYCKYDYFISVEDNVYWVGWLYFFIYI